MSSKLENLLLKSKTPIKNNVFLISNVFTIETHKKIYNNLMNSENWGLLQTSNIDSQESKFWINSLGWDTKKKQNTFNILNSTNTIYTIELLNMHMKF